MRVWDYGEHALLAELDDPHTVPSVRAAIAATPGVVDAVAGACTVLAVVEPGYEGAVRAALQSAVAVTDPAGAAESVTIRVSYDGADLAEVAAEVGMSAADVVACHSGADYVVRFCGFSPGFAYLDGLDGRLHVPRRSDPRTSVPVGAVGIAGEFTGVYPRPSPGGWRLLGHTDLELWDVSRRVPALLVPGTRVRFEPA
jgi:KipI family sensor histidine kinase inhibitor